MNAVAFLELASPLTNAFPHDVQVLELIVRDRVRTDMTSYLGPAQRRVVLELLDRLIAAAHGSGDGELVDGLERAKARCSVAWNSKPKAVKA